MRSEIVHDHLHVVLDEEDGQRQLAAHEVDQLRSAYLVSRGFMPAVGSSSRRQARLGGERAGDLQPTLIAVGQVARAGRPRLPARPTKARTSRARTRGARFLRYHCGRPEHRAGDGGPKPCSARPPGRSPAPSCSRRAGWTGTCARCRGRRWRWVAGRGRAPSKAMRPPLGRTRPVTTLKKVVLPAPLGPIRPMMALRGMTRSISLSATTPPKRLVSPRTSRMGATRHGAARGPLRAARPGWPRSGEGRRRRHSTASSASLTSRGRTRRPTSPLGPEQHHAGPGRGRRRTTARA